MRSHKSQKLMKNEKIDKLFNSTFPLNKEENKENFHPQEDSDASKLEIVLEEENSERNELQNNKAKESHPKTERASESAFSKKQQPKVVKISEKEFVPDKMSSVRSKSKSILKKSNYIVDANAKHTKQKPKVSQKPAQKLEESATKSQKSVKLPISKKSRDISIQNEKLNLKENEVETEEEEIPIQRKNQKRKSYIDSKIAEEALRRESCSRSRDISPRNEAYLINCRSAYRRQMRPNKLTNSQIQRNRTERSPQITSHKEKIDVSPNNIQRNRNQLKRPITPTLYSNGQLKNQRAFNYKHIKPNNHLPHSCIECMFNVGLRSTLLVIVPCIFVGFLIQMNMFYYESANRGSEIRN